MASKPQELRFEAGLFGSKVCFLIQRCSLGIPWSSPFVRGVRFREQGDLPKVILCVLNRDRFPRFQNTVLSNNFPQCNCG